MKCWAQPREGGACEGGRGELGMGREEGGDDVLVLDAAEGAGGVEEAAAGLHERAEVVEEFALPGRVGGDPLRSGGPLEVRGAAPRAGAAAGSVDQDAVVGTGGGRRDRDRGGGMGDGSWGMGVGVGSGRGSEI